jgi:hypothetical protein
MMSRTIAYWLGSAIAAAGLAWVAWRGASHDPATLISRVDVIATAAMLAGLPFAVRRRFGPMARGWKPRLLRVAGYAVVIAVMAVKPYVEEFELRGRYGAALAGVWAGEVVFLVVLAAYVAALLAVTAQRPPARPATLAIGTGAGVILGIAAYASRPLADHLRFSNGWLTGLFDLGRVIAVPVVAGVAVAAAVRAARKITRRESQQSRMDLRARQGFAAGLCAGAAAALVVSVLGISTIALMPNAASSLQWTLPGGHMPPGSAYLFEVSFTEAAAGFLLVLIIFPLLGAGLGAWGGLFVADNSGRRPGEDGGGGGGRGPDHPVDPPPPGGRELPDDLEPALFGDWDELSEFPELAEDHELAPAGHP